MVHRPRVVQGVNRRTSPLGTANGRTPSHGTTPPRPKLVGIPSGVRDVKMENIHPLRLRLLLEIERTGSISAAADECAIAQPSASMHLRTLETAIGRRLVSRNGRGSSLTPAGKVVACHAAEALATLDSMRAALETLETRSPGELKLAASLTPSLVLLPRILRELSDRHPGVRISLKTIPSGTVVSEVAHGDASIGIAGGVPSTDGIARRQILVDELVGIAPVGLLRFDGGSVAVDELARHSLLLGGEASSTRVATERSLAQARYRPSRVCVFDSYAAITSAVADGVGVSFVSRLLVREQVERGDLIAFRVSGVARMTRPIHIVQPTAQDATPEEAALLSLLSQAPWSTADRLRPAADLTYG